MKKINTKHFILSILISLVFLTVYIHSDDIYKGYVSAKYFYFIGITSIIIIIVAINFILSKQDYEINFNLIDLFFVLFVIYSFLRLIFTSNKTSVNGDFIILLFLIILYFIWKEFTKRNFTLTRISTQTVVLIFVFLSCGLLESVIGILQLYDILPGYINPYFKVNGSFTNPSFYASYLSTILPFSLGVYKFIKSNLLKPKILKYLALSTFLASLIMLPVLRSRASYIGSVAGIVFIYLHDEKIKEKIKYFTNTLLKKCIIVVFIIAISLFCAKILYNIRPQSVEGRILIWKNTINMIKDSPIFGRGYMQFAVDYGHYQANYFADNERTIEEKYLAGDTNHAYNTYLQIAAELGIIGLVLWIGLVTTVLLKINKNISTLDGKVENKFINISAKSSLVSVLIAAFFSSPFTLPTNINFVFLLSLISMSRLSKNFNFRINKSNRSSLAVISIILSVLTLSKTINLFEYQRQWKEAIDYAKFGLYTESTKKFEKIYNPLKSSSEFLFTYGAELVQLAGNDTALEDRYRHYEKATELLERSKFNFTSVKQYTNLGICYENMKNFSKSEKNFEYASAMVPNLLYPKFRLVNLLAKESKFIEAKLLCTNILNSKVKVRSTAVLQMKEQVKTLLKSLVLMTKNDSLRLKNNLHLSRFNKSQ